MSPIQRIIAELDARHYKKNAFAKEIGLPVTTLSTWMNRNTDFPASYVIPIARFFGKSPLWVLTGEESDADVPVAPLPAEPVPALTEEEAFILDTFRALDREGKSIVASCAVEETRRMKTEQGKTSTAG